MKGNRITRSAVALCAVVSFLSISDCASGQSKLYITAGIFTLYGSSVQKSAIDLARLQTLEAPRPVTQLCAGLEYEHRMLGSVSLVTGASFFGTRYDVGWAQASASASAFRGRYLVVPVFARWNVGNDNLLMMDGGICPFYLMAANLKESIIKFGDPVYVEGDITRHSKRIFLGFEFRALALINRFYLGLTFFAPFAGQSALKDLEDHWALNQQQSTYIDADGFMDYYAIGVKTGVRIR